MSAKRTKVVLELVIEGGEVDATIKAWNMLSSWFNTPDGGLRWWDITSVRAGQDVHSPGVFASGDRKYTAYATTWLQAASACGVTGHPTWTHDCAIYEEIRIRYGIDE